MLHNRFAGQSLKLIDRLYEAGTPNERTDCLCKGVNDGEELKRSIEDLTKYIPCMQSVSVVPVGLSKYRDGLYPLEPFTKEDACQVIDLIEMWQKSCIRSMGSTLSTPATSGIFWQSAPFQRRSDMTVISAGNGSGNAEASGLRSRGGVKRVL